MKKFSTMFGILFISTVLLGCEMTEEEEPLLPVSQKMEVEKEIERLKSENKEIKKLLRSTNASIKALKDSDENIKNNLEIEINKIEDKEQISILQDMFQVIEIEENIKDRHDDRYQYTQATLQYLLNENDFPGSDRVIYFCHENQTATYEGGDPDQPKKYADNGFMVFFYGTDGTPIQVGTSDFDELRIEKLKDLSEEDKSNPESIKKVIMIDDGGCFAVNPNKELTNN